MLALQEQGQNDEQEEGKGVSLSERITEPDATHAFIITRPFFLIIATFLTFFLLCSVGCSRN